MVCGYSKFLVAFGGQGAYIDKIKVRVMLNDLVVFDLEKQDYAKFEGDMMAYENSKIVKTLAEL